MCFSCTNSRISAMAIAIAEIRELVHEKHIEHEYHAASQAHGEKP